MRICPAVAALAFCVPFVGCGETTELKALLDERKKLLLEHQREAAKLPEVKRELEAARAVAKTALGPLEIEDDKALADVFRGAAPGATVEVSRGDDGSRAVTISGQGAAEDGVAAVRGIAQRAPVLGLLAFQAGGTTWSARLQQPSTRPAAGSSVPPVPPTPLRKAPPASFFSMREADDLRGRLTQLDEEILRLLKVISEARNMMRESERLKAMAAASALPDRAPALVAAIEKLVGGDKPVLAALDVTSAARKLTGKGTLVKGQKPDAVKAALLSATVEGAGPEVGVTISF